ncbi:restriction endonuclease subunit S [Aeromonas veronii]|uniref:restriction endonuclease subunit S n=1 Tax=Aeromonas veronii TaxID=654 RepID=UPI002F40338A
MGLCNWSEIRISYLGEVSVINYGYTESATSDPIGPKFLRITDIQDSGVNWDDVPFCQIDATGLKKFKLAQGDIVFARTGATTGKSFLVINPPEAVFASYLIRLRLQDISLLPEFVSLYFQSKEYWDAIRAGSSGSAQGGFNASKLAALMIPVPPLPEQQRIVAILDEAFETIAAARANAEQNRQNARALFESYLQSVFSQRGNGWVEKTLGDIGKVSMCKRVLKEQTSAIGDIPFYKIGSFGKKADSFISTELYSQYKEKYSFPKKGDILLSAAGTIGRRVIFDGNDAYFQDSNIVWIANDQTQVLNCFLYHFYGACEWNATKGATILRLYNEDLRRIVIAFPTSLDVQKSIAAQMDLIFDATQRLESLYQCKIAALDELKQSLLQQAFSGQL